MLQISNISKKYVTGDLEQTALDGVSLNLRDNEFVAILGPSGSGKTTLLNVIGGLDRYDSGDLIINGISTKKYTDRDWDSYRNHTVGFIFQSYNLIPHQTVLANVELALTISGISRSERKKRAIKALEDVGLGNQLHKKPNQMSGGQMQRVAIARALVNNPDILLADEPTGALDSDTSVQVMELLKEVSKDRLVVMVTHNPELAEEYASRIVRLRDGKIMDDTNPYEVEQESEAPHHENMGKASMSFFTALSLSFNNLLTKKGRTILTAFAGSIGIIGIALILSLSTGFQNYIDKIQEDTLSTYPLVIQSETADMTSMMTAFAAGSMQEGEGEEDGVVTEQQMISQVFAQIGSNDLRSFKSYIDSNMNTLDADINAIKYSYNITPQIYSADTSKEAVQVNPATLFSDLMGGSMGGGSGFSMDSNVFYEMIDNKELLDSQYEMLLGRWPEDYNETVMVLPAPDSMSDYMAYTLGLRDTAELEAMVEKVMEGEEVENIGAPMQWSYDDLLKLRFRLVAQSDLYTYNEEYEVWEDMSDDEEYMKKLIADGEELSVVGIVCPKDGVTASALSPGVAYTSKLTDFIIENSSDSKIVKDQLADPETDVFTGRKFEGEEDAEQSGLDFGDMISVDGDILASAFGMNIDTDALVDEMGEKIAEAMGTVEVDTSQAQTDFSDTLSLLATGMLNGYISANADPATGEAVLRVSDSQTIVSQYLASGEAQKLLAALETKYLIPKDTFSQVYSTLLVSMISSYVSEEGTFVPTEPEEPPQISASGNAPSVPSTPSVDMSQLQASIKKSQVSQVVSSYTNSSLVMAASAAMAARMCETEIQSEIYSALGTVSGEMIGSLSSSFSVDGDKIAQAFSFDLDEEELGRLMSAMSSKNTKRSAEINLANLGYADKAEPTAISIYLVDFAAKERFIEFIDNYNTDMEKSGNEEMVISYNDMTGVLMSSVKTIVDSVSYVLIAFVAVSLIVSSIMIGIITYISVLERTKEIGVLRAIGASKRNISQVFNAETFIIGLCSGLMGVGISLSMLPPINAIIHSLTGSGDISAQLPVTGAIILIILSMLLTIIGGLIPSKKAAQKDPVIALRSE
ncbi:MAG: ABC transporter ATP-binding protein/permease [Ruminococcaceae bacterium]|nr:ABC transporter ATP-binding protein/permease [Oscillospiraceae bacterium]